MTFGPFPAVVANAIQQRFLERAFIEPLFSKLAYRQVAMKEDFPARIGQTIIKTKLGLMLPNTTPLNPSTNTNIDNGLIQQDYGTEQYTLSIAQYPQVAPDINLLDDETTIDSFLNANAFRLGAAQATCVDRLARNALFNAYMSGNTFVTTTLGAPATTITVDDTRGFQFVSINGTVTPVSPSNPLPIIINGTAYSITSFANDVVNISTAAVTGGTSGTITASANISVLNGTAGNAVIGVFAPLILRPNGRTTTPALLSTDTLTLKDIRAAIALLSNNCVPTIRGAYNLYCNSTVMNELYSDPEFQIIQRGTSVRDPAYENAWIYNTFLRCRFIETTETFVQPPQAGPVAVNQTIQRTLVCGDETLVENIFTRGMNAVANLAKQNGPGSMESFPSVMDALGNRYSKDGFYMWMRGPIDRLAEIVSMTSNYVGGFVVPTDVTTNSSIIPTASNSYYKRGVILESV